MIYLYFIFWSLPWGEGNTISLRFVESISSEHSEIILPTFLYNRFIIQKVDRTQMKKVLNILHKLYLKWEYLQIKELGEHDCAH